MTPTHHPSTPWAGRLHALVVAALLLSATGSPAGRVPEEWDDLPDIDSFSFSETSVGLTTTGGEYYLLERSTNRVEEVLQPQFEQNFPGSIGARAAEVKEEPETASTVLLRTSNGRELTTRDAECSEGMDTEHALEMDGAAVKDHVAPCHSVSCAEIVGDNLWLGTRYDGEYGEYPADGIVVQSMGEGLLVKTLSTRDGLTGDLIRVIRVDPFDKMVWVATNEGINVVGQDHRIRKSLFFRQDLDPESGMPVLELTPTKQKSSRTATLLKEMRTSNAKQFHAVAISIPPAVRERFTDWMLDGRHRYGDASSAEEAFVPTEMNVLVPLYLEDARSSDEKVREAALSCICLFNDQRVLDYLVEQRKLPAQPQPSLGSRFVKSCLDKFTKLGLVSAQSQDELIASILEQQRDALERIRSATSNTSADNRLVVSLANDLKHLGSRQGIDLINEYFLGMDGNRRAPTSEQEFLEIVRDSSLYEWVETNLGAENEMIPAMLEGLRKIWFPRAYRSGCRFFDMRWPGVARRFDATYAEAILLAIDRRPPNASPPPGSEDNCVEAFRSQLANPDVRQAFFKEVYPQLTPQQKELADRLGKEPPAPLGPYSDLGRPGLSAG